jgi:hypothetical protein
MGRALLLAAVLALLVTGAAFRLLLKATLWSLEAMARDPLGWGAAAAAWAFAWLVVVVTLFLLVFLAILFYLAEVAERAPLRL